MSPKHTQGDWVEHNGDILAGGLVVARVHGPNRADLIAERNANRSLITTAPDLLEALEGLVIHAENSREDDPMRDKWIDRARAAIAKAKGEA